VKCGCDCLHAPETLHLHIASDLVRVGVFAERFGDVGFRGGAVLAVLMALAGFRRMEIANGWNLEEHFWTLDCCRVMARYSLQS
jgi:hypothetical protein